MGQALRLAGSRRRLAAAQRAYGTLPPAQRAALVLRYVDGLAPADVAARLGVDEEAVEALLHTARTELLPPRPYAALARPAALAVVGVALAMTTVTPPHRQVTPPRALPAPAYVPPSFAQPGPLAPDVTAVADPGTAPFGTRRRPAEVVVGEAVPAPRTPPGGRTACRTVCVPGTPRSSGDVLAVTLPDPVSEALGQRELVVEQEYLSLCELAPAPPAGVARCVPGSA